MIMEYFKYGFWRIFNDRYARHDLTVLKDDVFLAAYPRSGSTWVRFILGTILSETKTTWENMEDCIPDIYRNSDKRLLRLKSPRILKTHSLYDQRYSKVIYIVRDVRDVLLSYHSFRMKFTRKKILIDNLIEDFIKVGVNDFGTWDENIESYVNSKDKIINGFILIRYEDLKINTFENINKMLDFLNIIVPDQKITSAIRWASFENMKRMEEEQQNTADLLRNSDIKIRFMRSGKTSGWKEILTKEQIIILNTRFHKTLRKFGYL